MKKIANYKHITIANENISVDEFIEEITLADFNGENIDEYIDTLQSVEIGSTFDLGDYTVIVEDDNDVNLLSEYNEYFEEYEEEL